MDMKLTKIKHPSHPHTLKLKPPGERPYNCDGCKELGLGSYYGCKNEDCNFYLHEECAIIDYSHPAFHPFFKNSIFFPQREAFDRKCDACGKDILGYVYRCSKNTYDLHPCCLKLSPTLDLKEIDHLQLVEKASKKCLKCNSKEIVKGLKGWSYVSSSNDFCFHVACVKELIVENYNRGYFNRSNAETGAPTNSSATGEIGAPSNSFANGEIGAPSNSSALQIYSPGTEIARQDKFRKTAGKIWKIAKMVFKLIVSAIFGDPITAIAILIEALFS